MLEYKQFQLQIVSFCYINTSHIILQALVWVCVSVCECVYDRPVHTVYVWERKRERRERGCVCVCVCVDVCVCVCVCVCVYVCVCIESKGEASGQRGEINYRKAKRALEKLF